MTELPPPRPEQPIEIVREIEDPRTMKAINPHLYRLLGLALGILSSVITVFVVQLLFKDLFYIMISFMTSIFPAPYEFIGFVVGFVLIFLILWVIQVFITWAVVKFLIKQQRIHLYRTRIQHLVARLMKWFGIGFFLAIFLALIGIGFGGFTGDLAFALFFSCAVFISLIYVGSSVGQMLTDVLFYYYYRKEQGLRDGSKGDTITNVISKYFGIIGSILLGVVIIIMLILTHIHFFDIVEFPFPYIAAFIGLPFIIGGIVIPRFYKKRPITIKMLGVIGVTLLISVFLFLSLWVMPLGEILLSDISLICGWVAIGILCIFSVNYIISERG